MGLAFPNLVVMPSATKANIASLLLHFLAAGAPRGPLVPHGGRPGHSDPSVAGVRGGGLLVAPRGQVGVWCSPPSSSPVPIVVYHCVSAELGSTPVGSDGLECVVEGRKFDALESTRQRALLVQCIYLERNKG